MRKIRRSILTIITLASVVYLSGIIAGKSFNPFLWSDDVRMIAAFLFGITTSISLLFVNHIDD